LEEFHGMFEVTSGTNDADGATMKEIAFSKFRANVFAVLRAVEQTREAILITRSGKPLAEIRSVPISAAQRERLHAEPGGRDLKLINRDAEALDGLEHQAAKPSRPARRAKKKKSRKRP
jgi:prevent-host-death family protein